MKKLICMLLVLSALPVLPVSAAETAVPADIDPVAYENMLTEHKYLFDDNSDGVITEEELKNVGYAHISLEGVTDISWLSKLESCTQLILSGGTLTDFSVLESLPELIALDLESVPLTDLEFVKKLHLDSLTLKSMDQITPEQRAAVVQIEEAQIYAGTAARISFTPHNLMELRMTIQDTDIACFPDGSGDERDLYEYIFGKKPGKAKYTVYEGETQVCTGTLTILEAPAPEDPPLKNTSVQSFRSDRSCWYNPGDEHVSSGPVALVNGTLYTFEGSKAEAVETDVKDYAYYYARNYHKKYNYADLVLKNDGTFLVNGQQIRDFKVREYRQGYVVSESGDLEALVPKGDGFCLISVASDFGEFVKDCHPLYMSKYGKLKYYGFRLAGDGTINSYSNHTGIGKILTAVPDGPKCYILDEKHALYELDFSNVYDDKKLAEDVEFVGFDDNQSTLYYTKSDGTNVTISNRYYTTTSRSYQALGIREGTFYIPEYQDRGLSENEAVFSYYIDADDTMRMCFNKRFCSLTHVRDAICTTYDTEANEGYAYFLRTDGTIMQYRLDSGTWTEAGAAPKPDITGDLNADGAFDQKDTVLLSKWLCTEDVKLTDWKAADFNTDGNLTAADLTSMKRLLLSTPEES